MDVYETCKSLNRRLASGERIYFRQGRQNAPEWRIKLGGDRLLRFPRIALYAGSGASHSWLWFAEIFDKMGFYDLVPLDEKDIRGGKLQGLDVLSVSGGDTFAIAAALGRKGAAEMERFITDGGLYLGSCAGAYLLLHSSKEDLNLFNYVKAKITNLTSTLPEPFRLKEKFCTAYGCSYIFHPVREEVALETNGFPPFSCSGTLTAPLYGGPPMVPSDTAQVLATYKGFTDKTLFLVEKKLVEDTLLGKAAVIRENMGKGHIYLFGPHLEHPHFPEANRLLVDAMYWDLPIERTDKGHRDELPRYIQGKANRALLKDIKREISNARIVAVGMESLHLHWTIGNKVFESAKIRVFIEAIWTRLRELEKVDRTKLLPGQDELILQRASELTLLLRDLRRSIISGDSETTGKAENTISLLKKTCALFLEIYFSTQMSCFVNEV